MAWVHDKVREDIFIRFNAKFKWQDRISLSMIDIEKSKRNNARVECQMDTVHSGKIAVSLASGRSVPGVTVRNVGTVKYFVLAGNHRIDAAKKNKLKTVGGYIIECGDEIAEIITRSDNALEGKGQTDEEIFEHIYYMHTTYGTSLTELANSCSIQPQKAQYMIRAKKLGEKLELANINTDHLSISSLNALNLIAVVTDVVYEAARLAGTYKMSADRVSDMVREIKAAGSERSMHTILAQWSSNLAEMAALPKAPRTSLNKTKMFNLFKKHLRLLTIGKKGKPIKTVNDLSLDLIEAQRFLNEWDEINERMKPLIGQCKQWVKKGKKSK